MDCGGHLGNKKMDCRVHSSRGDGHTLTRHPSPPSRAGPLPGAHHLNDTLTTAGCAVVSLIAACRPCARLACP
ncbi:hypothetical protein CU044_2275 [Streptomyces sp. L-9-10]|nr:hypothetical protein CU044_2275 [Streptomyces sp. L-9-10]